MYKNHTKRKFLYMAESYDKAVIRILMTMDIVPKKYLETPIKINFGDFQDVVIWPKDIKASTGNLEIVHEYQEGQFFAFLESDMVNEKHFCYSITKFPECLSLLIEWKPTEPWEHC